MESDDAWSIFRASISLTGGEILHPTDEWPELIGVTKKELLERLNSLSEGEVITYDSLPRLLATTRAWWFDLKKELDQENRETEMAKKLGITTKSKGSEIPTTRRSRQRSSVDVRDIFAVVPEVRQASPGGYTSWWAMMKEELEEEEKAEGEIESEKENLSEQPKEEKTPNNGPKPPSSERSTGKEEMSEKSVQSTDNESEDETEKKMDENLKEENEGENDDENILIESEEAKLESDFQSPMESIPILVEMESDNSNSPNGIVSDSSSETNPISPSDTSQNGTSSDSVSAENLLGVCLKFPTRPTTP